MKKVLLVCLLCMGPGCITTQPTYLPVEEGKLFQIAENNKITLEELLQREVLVNAELSKDLNMDVIGLEVEENGQKTYFAKIAPAVDEAGRRLIAPLLKDPDRPDRWIGGALAAGGILLMSVLGIRGERRRRKQNGAA